MTDFIISVLNEADEYETKEEKIAIYMELCDYLGEFQMYSSFSENNLNEFSIDENNGLVAYGGGAKVSVFKATYDGSGVPTLESWQTISLLSSSSTEGINVDGLALFSHGKGLFKQTRLQTAHPKTKEPEALALYSIG